MSAVVDPTTWKEKLTASVIAGGLFLVWYSPPLYDRIDDMFGRYQFYKNNPRSSSFLVILVMGLIYSLILYAVSFFWKTKFTNKERLLMTLLVGTIAFIVMSYLSYMFFFWMPSNLSDSTRSWMAVLIAAIIMGAITWFLLQNWPAMYKKKVVTTIKPATNPLP